MQKFFYPHSSGRLALLVWVCLWSGQGWAAVATANLAHQLELQMLWLDALEHPGHRTQQPSAAGSEDTGRRTLGLERLRWSFVWGFTEESRLHFTLRPDAPLQRQGTDVRQRVDTRAGHVYQGRRALELLDSYQLAFALGQQAEVAFGVWAALAPPATAYEVQPQFGLTPLLPEGFWGARLYWQQDMGGLKPPPLFNSELLVALWWLQGPGDRCEANGFQAHTYDRAPIASDPYGGAALQLQWFATPGLEVSYLLGFGEQGTGATRSQQIYTDLVVRQRWPWPQPLEFVGHGRFVEESWPQATGGDLPALEQLSAMATAKWQVTSRQGILAGLHVGRSERHGDDNKYAYKGWQLDLGWEAALTTGCMLQVLAVEEHREKKATGSPAEAGFSSELHAQKMLRRFALALRYTIGDDPGRAQGH